MFMQILPVWFQGKLSLVRNCLIACFIILGSNVLAVAEWSPGVVGSFSGTIASLCLGGSGGASGVHVKLGMETAAVGNVIAEVCHGVAGCSSLPIEVKSSFNTLGTSGANLSKVDRCPRCLRHSQTKMTVVKITTNPTTT